MYYSITGKYLSGCQIIAFDFTDSNGKTIKVSADTAYKFVDNGSVKDYILVKINGENWIKGVNGKSLKDVPNKSNNKQTQLKAVDVIKVDDKVLGIVVEDNDNITHRISNIRAWELARDGLISNLTFGVNNEHKVKTIQIGGQKNGKE